MLVYRVVLYRYGYGDPALLESQFGEAVTDGQHVNSMMRMMIHCSVTVSCSRCSAIPVTL